MTETITELTVEENDSVYVSTHCFRFIVPKGNVAFPENESSLYHNVHSRLTEIAYRWQGPHGLLTVWIGGDVVTRRIPDREVNDLRWDLEKLQQLPKTSAIPQEIRVQNNAEIGIYRIVATFESISQLKKTYFESGNL